MSAVTVADLFAKLGLRTDKSSFDRANRMLGAVKTALVGIASFQTVKWFKGVIDETAQAADHFAKTSKAIGLTTEALQQLTFAAGLGGLQAKELETGLMRLARSADDAARGSQMTEEAFQRLGVNVKGADGNLKNTDVLLEEIADSFANMPDSAEKTALAMTLLGRSGAKMIPMLNGGSKAIRAQREEFVALGAQIDGDVAAAFEQFNDDQARIKAVWQGIKNQAVIALLPTLQDMVTKTLAWVKANRELLQQRIQAFMQALVKGAILAGKAVARLIEIFEWFVDHPGLLKTLLGIVLAIKGLGIAKTIGLSILGLGTALRSAAIALGPWAVAAGPFVAIGAAIAGLIVLFPQLRSAIMDAVDAATDFLDKLIGVDEQQKKMREREVKQFEADKKRLSEMPEGPEKEALRQSIERRRQLGRSRMAKNLGLSQERFDQLVPDPNSKAALHQRVLDSHTTGPITVNSNVNVTMPTADPAALGREAKKAATEAAEEVFQKKMRHGVVGAK